jgi:xylitol oxidase
MPERNWAANYEYRAASVHEPGTVEELQELIAAAPAIRVLGSRHSFTDIADSAELVSLAALPGEVAVDRAAGTVSVPGAIRYGELAGALAAEQLALANLASLPHISVAGAVATATHGSGERIGNLSSAVSGLELVTADGELRIAGRGDPDFAGLVVGLGATGAVIRVTLAVEPAYEMRQRVFEGLAWDALLEHFDAIAASGDSVSVFTRWGEHVDQVWVKTRVSGEPETLRDELFGATAASVERHPIIGLDPVNCTPQLGVPGPWSERLPHFRMGFTPSSGDEIQSEYLLARPHATDAIDALRRLAPQIRPLIQVTEVRMIAADELWMSTAYGQDTVAIHFTWVGDQDAVERLLVEIETTLAPFGARPHWGKLFHYRADTLAPLYERHRDFVALIERLDPRGAFRNRWLERHVLGDR